MKHLLPIILAASAASIPGFANAELRFHMPMECLKGQVAETVSAQKFDVQAAGPVENVEGIKGDALRLDGYSNYVVADIELGDLSQFTFSVWCAMETWPIIEHDVANETDYACIAGNYDAAGKKGFGFFVNRVGTLVFRFFSGGWPVEIKADQPLPLYKWNNLVAVVANGKASIYNNGQELGTANAQAISADGDFMIGKSADERKMGPFHLNTINGIVDEIELYDDALDIAVIQGWATDKTPQLNTIPAYAADDLLRPMFHGMPSRNWTNENHGLIYYNGLYHTFFQKNANGPYMSRLQWGHIVSKNLYDWEEMPIAIGSDKWYDTKGCWSGCVVVDDVVTGGKPNIIYTGVDYAKAMIAQASPNDEELLTWTKRANPIIGGKPAGLSDDFRDPYFFRNGDDAYLIVGTSKDGKGACTLHKYNPSNNSWSNDGSIFFAGSSVAAHGSFWEMPSVTNMDGNQLFVVTPQGLLEGVKALYWTGSINADGTFQASGNAVTVELPGFAKEGYGMLSPSVMQVDGKTIAMGIVPDKLDAYSNYNLGWAHVYSLPREWTLDAQGKLLQKPYSGLEEMRNEKSMVAFEKTLNGRQEVGSMPDRQLEIIGEFTVADADFGFNLFQSGDNGAKLFYSPASRMLTLDIRSLNRLVNDSRNFNGLYQTTLPEDVAKGSVMKIHVFVDRSILDIFINDKWASSVRIFPTDSEACGVEVFSQDGETQAKVKAWTLETKSTGIGFIPTENQISEYVDVFSIDGALLRQKVHHTNATEGLAQGIYIIGGKKVLVKG